jgi:hypothetical protein
MKGVHQEWLTGFVGCLVYLQELPLNNKCNVSTLCNLIIVNQVFLGPLSFGKYPVAVQNAIEGGTKGGVINGHQ